MKITKHNTSVSDSLFAKLRPDAVEEKAASTPPPVEPPKAKKKKLEIPDGQIFNKIQPAHKKSGFSEGSTGYGHGSFDEMMKRLGK